MLRPSLSPCRSSVYRKISKRCRIEQLPALSVANVRELLVAVIPLPRLTPEEAIQLVIQHLCHRARSTRSRLKKQAAGATPSANEGGSARAPCTTAARD